MTTINPPRFVPSLAVLALTALRAERDRHAAEMAEALRDPVTSLPTRRSWRPQAEEILRLRRCALGLLDLNGFKVVNDTHGHAAGDRVLHEVAKRLRTELNHDALLGRAGGDELLIVSPRAVHWDRVHAAITRPITLPAGESASVGAAIGVATTLPGADLSPTLHAADCAMYEAKRTGVAWLHTAPHESDSLAQR